MNTWNYPPFRMYLKSQELYGNYPGAGVQTHEGTVPFT